MSNKRQAEDNYQNQDRRRGDGSDDKRRRRQKKHKHFYVVLDDWNNGFSLYKIDADDIFNDEEQEGHLDPPVLQLESPVGDMCAMAFSALGTKIFALMDQSCGLIYDTETAVLAMDPHAPAQMVCGSSTYLRVGEMLYALSYHASENKYSFAMSWGPITDSVTPKEGWSWKSLPSPPPEFNSHVAAYALHPDGCSIFITTDHESRMCTYSFDTKRSVWTWLGYWALPFHGQGHFDTELDAWVGLRFLEGSVCTCQVVSPTTILAPANHHRQQELDCKMTQEKLAEDRIFSSRCISTSLIHIGSSKFCIVQSLARELEQGHPHPLTDHDGCVLQITTFGLKYSGKGELRTTSKQHFTRSFLVSRHIIYQFTPTAFWM